MSDIERPTPERDLDWRPTEARGFGERVVDIWVEFLDRLHDDLPVARDRSAAEVRAAVTLDVPRDPMPIDDL